MALIDVHVAKGGSKEGFLKKLQICMKHYDYKDETKDVRGKVNLDILLQDLTNYYRLRG